MYEIKFHIDSKPSNSKGWARYSAALEDGTPVVQSRTGNHWVSADHRGEVKGGEIITLTMQVMLRVGQGNRRREEITKVEHQLVARAGAECEVEHKPGSQGLRLQITGAEPAE